MTESTIKTVVLPTDFSVYARNAMRYALALFAEEPTRFILLNTYEEPQSGSSMIISIMDILKENSENDLAAELAWVQAHYPDQADRFEVRSAHGNLVEVIRKMELDNLPDLVIMGTQGASGLREVLMGSNTSAVIRNSATPVIAVPHNVTFSLPQQIVFAADFEHLEELATLDPFREMAQRLKAHVHVLNILKEGKPVPYDKQAIKDRLSAYFGAISHSFHFIVNKHVDRDIELFVHEQHADMLLMIPQRRSFFDRLWHQSITEKLAFHTDVPLFALHQ